MKAQDMKELPRIDQLCTTWRAFAAQIRDTMNERTNLERSEHADALALGQESAKLGLQIQLWVRDVSQPPRSIG